MVDLMISKEIVTNMLVVIDMRDREVQIINDTADTTDKIKKNRLDLKIDLVISNIEQDNNIKKEDNIKEAEVEKKVLISIDLIENKNTKTNNLEDNIFTIKNI